MTAIRPLPAGPSSLRRMVTSQSDVFLAGHHAASSDVMGRGASQSNRRPSGTDSSVARTARSSWHADSVPTRAGTMSTKATSHFGPSRPMSIVQKPSPAKTRSRSEAGTSPGKSFPPRNMGPGGITLPLNNSVSHLATLSNSAHTLSPYARAHEHIAVRSFPHLGKANPSVGSSSSASLVGANGDLVHGPVKARRKRIFHLNKDSDTKSSDPPMSPDVDDEIVTPDGAYSSTQHPPLSRSSSVEYAGLPRIYPNQRPMTLSGAANRMMHDATARPNYGRAPASRTSYGFPPM